MLFQVAVPEKEMLALQIERGTQREGQEGEH